MEDGVIVVRGSGVSRAGWRWVVVVVVVEMMMMERQKKQVERWPARKLPGDRKLVVFGWRPTDEITGLWWVEEVPTCDYVPVVRC
jgi:hypothetical protein